MSEPSGRQIGDFANGGIAGNNPFQCDEQRMLHQKWLCAVKLPSMIVFVMINVQDGAAFMHDMRGRENRTVRRLVERPRIGQESRIEWHTHALWRLLREGFLVFLHGQA